MPPEPLAPPVPVAGTFSVGAGLLILDFDQPLQPAPLNIGNWRVFADLNRWNALTMDAAAPGPNQVTGTFATVLGAPPGTTVNYGPPPFDVLNIPGLPAPGFVDFPLLELP